MSTPPHTIDTRRALSVQQPWAWLIIHGGKDIENRTWTTPHRGTLYIHAGKKVDKESYADLVAAGVVLPPVEDLKLGGLIGKVNLHKIEKASHNKWAQKFSEHWHLKDPEPVEFEKLSGALGVFRVGDQKRVVELPAGFVIKTMKTESDPEQIPGLMAGILLPPFTAKLYRDGVLIEKFSGLTRLQATAKASAHAVKLAGLPGLASITAPACNCNDDTTKHHEP